MFWVDEIIASTKILTKLGLAVTNLSKCIVYLQKVSPFAATSSLHLQSFFKSFPLGGTKDSCAC